MVTVVGKALSSEFVSRRRGKRFPTKRNTRQIAGQEGLIGPRGLYAGWSNEGFVALFYDVGLFCDSDDAQNEEGRTAVSATASAKGCGADYYRAEGWGDFYNGWSPKWKGSAIVKSPLHYMDGS